MMLFRLSTWAFLVIGIILVLKAAFGATSPREMSPEDYWANYQRWVQFKLSKIEMDDEICLDQYSKLFDEDQVLKINLFLGMMENIDYLSMTSEEQAEYKNLVEVSDRLVAIKMAEHLMLPCLQSNYYACGYRLVQMNPHFILEKNIVDFDDIEKVIQVNLFSSSLGENLEDVLKPTQLARSHYVEERLTDVLEEQGVVLYAGHSRYGSASWFVPEKKGLDLSFHYLFRPTFTRITNRLQEADQKPGMIGLFGCDTAKYYLDGFSKAAPDSSILVTNEVISYTEATASLLTMINGLSGLKCKKHFINDLEGIPGKFEYQFIGFE